MNWEAPVYIPKTMAVRKMVRAAPSTGMPKMEILRAVGPEIGA